MGLKNIEEQVASKTHSDYVLHNMASIAAVWANMAQAPTELLWSADNLEVIYWRMPKPAWTAGRALIRSTHAFRLGHSSLLSIPA